jgi:hypothetical protein
MTADQMITVYPAEDRSYDRPEYEPFWAAAAARLYHFDLN